MMQKSKMIFGTRPEHVKYSIDAQLDRASADDVTCLVPVKKLPVMAISFSNDRRVQDEHIQHAG